MPTVAILPIKSFTRAKQRLAQEFGPEFRRALAEAMFIDALTSLTRSAALQAILVITEDPAARRIAAEHQIEVLADTGTGHNAAAQLGVGRAVEMEAQNALLVPGDCPLLDPREVDELIALGAVTPSALIVPDRHGTGTNALLLAPPTALPPAFGPGSCRRHAQNAERIGVSHQVVALPSLALDIDTPEDLTALQAALAPGDAPAQHTREVLSGLTQSRL